MQRNANFSLLLVCFFLSGLAGLIYQTAWTREFAFVFGTSNLAVATVLAAYMAGLAAGAAAAARLAHLVTRPLLTYGVLELGVGLTALGVPLAIHGSQAMYVSLFGGQPELPEAGGLSSALFYMVCSFAILMIPTAMMGATLPLLVRHSVHNDEQISGRIGLLYSINTAGAVVGTVAAAFWLLPSIGLRETIWVAAGVNGLVFLAAWALARSAGGELPAPSDEGTTPSAPLGRAVWILPLIFGSGLVSFTYEVLWTRLLEHLLGGSVYAFSTMLASFLMGIALGAAVASRYGSSRSRAGFGFAICQLGIALFSLVAFATVDSIPDLTHNLYSMGVSKLLTDWAASTLTLFPAAMLIGATFPFAVRILARDENDAGSASAKVYAVNTIGSVVGSVAAGFFIIPALGYAGTLIACVALNLILAIGAAITVVDLHARRLQIAAAICLVGLIVVPPGEPWRILRYSEIGQTANFSPVEYLGVGRAATVLLLDTQSHWFLRTNGNPEGRISPLGVRHNQANVARWLGGLPSLARPETESLLVVGFGGGVALETVPKTVKTIDVIELEPEVIEANRAIGDQRWRDPLKDPRVKLHLNDARNSLTLTDKRFDAIVSQPSHPWSAGASHLYTQEFFELAQDHLNPGGVFVQWIGLSFVDAALFKTLLATLTEVFEHVQVYNPAGNSGVLFIGSDSPFDTLAATQRAIELAPEDMKNLTIYVPQDILASLLLDVDGVRELAEGAEINRDDHNIMQIRSPKVFATSLRTGLQEVVGKQDPLQRAFRDQIDPFYMMRLFGGPRVERLVESVRDPLDAKVMEALTLGSIGKANGARALLVDALEQDPRHETARAAMLRLSNYAISQGRDLSQLVALPLEEEEAAVTSGWIAKAREDWEAVRALDSELAKVARHHPLSNHAYTLRAQWRIESNEPRLAREAVEIVDDGIWDGRRLEVTLLRARANVVAGEYLAAYDTFSYVDKNRGNKALTDRFAKQALHLLRKIPEDPEFEEIRTMVERKLRSLRR